jgi:bifunctional ADP-heptose synthase (sugar kinase/adenylyltransferase)
VDSRRKILKPPEALEIARGLRGNGATLEVVTGYFNPLLAEHAGKLEQARNRADSLMVVVTTPPNPVLPAVARAELVAALSVVDYVVLPEETALEEFLARVEAREIIRREAEDEILTRDLIEHVRSRQQAD